MKILILILLGFVASATAGTISNDVPAQVNIVHTNGLKKSVVTFLSVTFETPGEICTRSLQIKERGGNWETVVSVSSTSTGILPLTTIVPPRAQFRVTESMSGNPHRSLILQSWKTL